MKLRELNEIIDKRKEEIFEGNYSFNFYSEMQLNWKLLLNFLKSNSFEYNEKSKEEFLKYAKELKKNKTYLYTLQSIQALDGLDVLKKNKYTSRMQKKSNQYNFGEYHNSIIRKYIEECSECNEKRTIEEKNAIVVKITEFFIKRNITDYKDLKSADVRDFTKAYLQMDIKSGRRRYNWVFKDYLTFLYNNNYTTSNFAFLIDKVKSEKKKIPVVWNEDEIEKIVNVLPSFTRTEIRNKAIALLTIRLGIRCCDVKNLKFENIDWKKNTISFIQTKTKKQVILPLTEEVGTAIIDYIKKARPQSDSKFIFLTHDEYITPLSNGFNIREYLIKTYKLAGVDYLSKEKKGIHTFRHALASNMLKKGIPVNIISSTLGHANTNSTKTYLRVDTSKLKECCLEVPYGK